MADTAINQLIVNKLTKEQFDSTTKNNNELYLVTDDDTYATVEQLNTKQNISNLSQSIDTSTTKYPSNNAVKTAIDNIDALPDQTGQGGKVLTTDGNTASWETINIPENVITSENYDNAKIWKGTEAEYNALASYDDNTTYIITDDYGTFFNGDYVTHEELEQGLAGKANADEVVDKTSDQTINGRKTFKQPIYSSNIEDGFVQLDSNGNLATSFGSLGSGNYKAAIMYVYNKDGSKISYLAVYYNNGAPFVLAGPSYNIPTSDKSNKLASTAFVHALLSQVINDSNIGSNYVYIGDLLIQWGYTERKATIDLIKPFANTDYFVSIQNISSVNVAGYGTDLINITALNTTSFELMNTDSKFPIKWIAIGQGA